MGSTFVAALIPRQFGLCRLGRDSRLYRLRRGQLQALTRDHSRVQELADQGRADPMRQAPTSSPAPLAWMSFYPWI